MKAIKSIFNFVISIAIIVLTIATIWLGYTYITVQKWGVKDVLCYEKYKIERALDITEIEPINETVLIMEQLKKDIEA